MREWALICGESEIAPAPIRRVDFSRPLAAVTFGARRDEICGIVAAGAAHRHDMIDVQSNVWCLAPAILAGEAVSLENPHAKARI